MNEKMTLNDEEIKMALKADITPAEELNERIMSMSGNKNHTSPMHRFALVASICLLVLLTSGAVVNAATGGRLITFIFGEDSKNAVVSEHDAEVKDEVINGVKYKTVNIDNGEWDYSASYALPEDIPLYALSTVVEKDGRSAFINLSTSLHTPSQHTSEDMYYSIRQEFYCQLVGSGVDFFKDEIIQNLRTAADEETEDYIKDALYDVADDIEKDRNMLICDCNFNDCLTSSWICEDISEYKNGEYTLIVNSVYGRPETYIVGIASGRIESSMVYSEEMEAELRNQGKEIIDRR